MKKTVVVTAFDRTVTVERVAVLSASEADLLERRLRALGWADDQHGRGLVDDPDEPGFAVAFVLDVLTSADAVLDVLTD